MCSKSQEDRGAKFYKMRKIRSHFIELALGSFSQNQGSKLYSDLAETAGGYWCNDIWYSTNQTDFFRVSQGGQFSQNDDEFSSF